MKLDFVVSFYTFLFGSSKKMKKDTTKSNFNYWLYCKWLDFISDMAVIIIFNFSETKISPYFHLDKIFLLKQIYVCTWLKSWYSLNNFYQIKILHCCIISWNDLFYDYNINYYIYILFYAIVFFRDCWLMMKKRTKLY